MSDDDKNACPPGIDDLTEAVGYCFETESVPMAYDVWGPARPGPPETTDDPWDVHFYPSLSEVVGGPDDGAIIYPDMHVDLQAVIEIFKDVEEFAWSSRSKNREPRYPGGVLDVVGWYDGHPVWLRIFDAPPDDATIDTVLEHGSGRLRPKDQPRT
jgi:hypothetical protein